MLEPSGATSRDASAPCVAVGRNDHQWLRRVPRATAGTPRSRARARRRLRSHWAGDAARRNVASGPAHRHAPSGTGRRRRRVARPTRPRAPRAGARLRPRAPPRRRRAPTRARDDRGAAPARSCRRARSAPARQGARSRTRDGLRERRAGRDKRCVFDAPRSPSLAYASAFAALPSSSAASVRSQVKSRSERPKCP